MVELQFPFIALSFMLSTNGLQFWLYQKKINCFFYIKLFSHIEFNCIKTNFILKNFIIGYFKKKKKNATNKANCFYSSPRPCNSVLKKMFFKIENIEKLKIIIL